jgi:hypothetical protein
MVKPNRKTRDSDLSKIQQRWVSPPKDRPWAKIPVDLIDGKRWRGMSVNARRILDALICQHFRYCQKDNGDLQISYSGFMKAGVTGRRHASAAIKELLASGMIKAKQGISKSPFLRSPSLYELTFYGGNSGGLIKIANRAFVFVPVDVMESPEWCKLSINARRMLDRLLIENRNHRNKQNGQLRVSFRQFAGHGIGWRLIAPSIEELTGAGLLAITWPKQRGPMQPPNLYRLTFSGTIDGPPTWRQSTIIPFPKKPKRCSKNETLAMQFKKYSIVPDSDTVLVPDSDTVLVPDSDTVDPPALVPDGDTSSTLLVHSIEHEPQTNRLTATGRASDRADRVTAYAMAHAGWIAKYGLPTHEEANILRQCYALGDTSADEWAVIQHHIRPSAGKQPEAGLHSENERRRLDHR